MKILNINSWKRVLTNSQVLKSGAALTSPNRCKSLQSNGLWGCIHPAQSDKFNSWTPSFTSHRGIHSTDPKRCDVRFYRLNKDKELSSRLPNMRILWELMELDTNFELSGFLYNATQAFRFVWDEIVSGNLDDLSEVLTPECMTKLRESLSRSTRSERELLCYSSKISFQAVPFIVGATFHSGSAGEKIVKVMVALTAVNLPLRRKDYNFEMMRTYSKNERSLWKISYINMQYKKYL